MKNLARSVLNRFDSNIIKRIKNIILFVSIGLIVLDIVFVFTNGFPTISQVVHDSSPKYTILIWLFGLLATNIFFQRTVNHKINLKRNAIILFAISCFFLVSGFLIKQPTSITCENFQTEIEKVETSYITRVLCKDFTNGLTEYENCNCKTLNCNENIHFKLDLTIGVKFLILLLGIVLGYFLWPAIKENTPHNN